MFFFIKKKIYSPFHEWSSTASRLEWEPLWGDSLLEPLGSHKLLVLIFYQALKDKQQKYWNMIQRKEYRL